MSSRIQTKGKDDNVELFKEPSSDFDASNSSGSGDIHPNGPLIKLWRLINYILYKRKGNRTEKCNHKITCWYLHAAEGALRNFTYAFSARILYDLVFSNRKQIIKALIGGGAKSARLSTRLVSGILSFSLTRSVKSLYETFKAIISIDSLMLGIFWGGFVGWFRLILCQLRRHSKYDEGKNASIAALIASLWMLIDNKRNRRIQIGCYIFARSLDSITKAIDDNGIYDRFLNKIAPYIPGYDPYDPENDPNYQQKLKADERKPPGNFELHWIMLYSWILTMYVLYTWGFEIEHFPHGIEKAMRIMTCPKPNDWNLIDKIARVRGYRFFGSPMVTSRYSGKHKK